MPILSLVTDNMLFLNERKGEFFSKKDCADGKVDLGTAAYEADTLPTELPHPFEERLICYQLSDWALKWPIVMELANLKHSQMFVTILR